MLLLPQSRKEHRPKSFRCRCCRCCRHSSTVTTSTCIAPANSLTETGPGPGSGQIPINQGTNLLGSELAARLPILENPSGPDRSLLLLLPRLGGPLRLPGALAPLHLPRLLCLLGRRLRRPFLCRSLPNPLALVIAGSSSTRSRGRGCNGRQALQTAQRPSEPFGRRVGTGGGDAISRSSSSSSCRRMTRDGRGGKDRPRREETVRIIVRRRIIVGRKGATVVGTIVSACVSVVAVGCRCCWRRRRP
mmetsp:Transcript_12506/g.26461  ORF Transcript_12506/g.26461 Transcript_12506/m.26461 type:complete len:247 (+) Transcript_12506:190-930(+)